MDSTGMFAAVTDYGNYAFKWTYHGSDDFREFVIGIERSPDYVLEKISHGKKFSGKKTKQLIKKCILESRRCGNYTREKARREWDLVNCSDFYYKEDFHEWYEKTQINDAHELSVYDYPPSEWAFATKLLPRLVDILKQELKQERQQETPA